LLKSLKIINSVHAIAVENHRDGAGVFMTENRNQQLLIQVSRAREALGNALGFIQDVDATQFDLDSVTSLLASSVRALFTAQEQQLETADPVGLAMNNLRTILQMMQNVDTSDVKIQATSTTIARILAILFPVYKELTAPISLPATSEPRAVPAPQKVALKKTAPQNDERRSAPRKTIEVDIGVQSDSNFFTGFTTDISTGGLFVATYDAPEVGHVVNLNFHLPDGPVMSVDGQVRWSREYNESSPDIPPGVGVRFIHLSSEDAREINAYMKKVQPLFYDD
jgi:uncharacterized protein (TIGR02266 family)